ncbi:unnamed protein product, partial [Brassica napus]
GGSSSNNRKPRCYRELASLFAEIAAAEMKRFKRNPRIVVLGIDGAYYRWAGNTSNLKAHEHTKEQNREC